MVGIKKRGILGFLGRYPFQIGRMMWKIATCKRGIKEKNAIEEIDAIGRNRRDKKSSV